MNPMKKLAGLLFCLFCFCQPAVAGDPWQMALSTHIQGNAKGLTIADVVDKEKTSAGLLEQYGQIALSKNQGEGGVQVAQVLLALNRAGADLTRVQLIGNIDERVLPIAASGVMKKINESVIRRLAELRKETPDRLQVEFTHIPSDLPDDKLFSDVSVEIAGKDKDEDDEGRYPVLVYFLGKNGERLAKRDFEAVVATKMTILVAKRDFVPGDTVTKADFDEQQQACREPEKIFKTLKELGDSAWNVNQKIEAGVPIDRTTLRASVELKKGELVTLLVRNSHINVRAHGRIKEVMDSGRSVLVENIDSKKELVGKPIGGGEVEIVF